MGLRTGDSIMDTPVSLLARLHRPDYAEAWARLVPR